MGITKENFEKIVEGTLAARKAALATYASVQEKKKACGNSYGKCLFDYKVALNLHYNDAHGSSQITEETSNQLQNDKNHAHNYLCLAQTNLTADKLYTHTEGMGEDVFKNAVTARLNCLFKTNYQPWIKQDNPSKDEMDYYAKCDKVLNLVVKLYIQHPTELGPKPFKQAIIAINTLKNDPHKYNDKSLQDKQLHSVAGGKIGAWIRWLMGHAAVLCGYKTKGEMMIQVAEKKLELLGALGELKQSTDTLKPPQPH